MEEGLLLTLIESMMEDCVFLNHVRTDDPYGGYNEEWQEGATFKAAVIKNTTTEAAIAEKSGIEEIFTVVTMKTVTLDYHDVLKRKSDNAIFRVTGKTVDSTAPDMSTVPIAKVSAERWVLPS